MNEKEKLGIKVSGICLFLALIIIAFGYMWIKLRDTQLRLAELEKGTSESFTAQQQQIDGISTDISGINGNIDVINENIDAINQDIEQTKAVQSNTNSALTRMRKQNEKDVQELREELKKD